MTVIKRIFVQLLFIFLPVLLFSCKCELDSALAAYNIAGDATTQQAVPPVNGAGKALLRGIYDSDKKNITFTCSWSNLGAAPITGGLYLGAQGTKGTMHGGKWVLSSPVAHAGSYHGTVKLDEAAEAALLNGNCYFSLATVLNSEELRGQLQASP